MKNTCRSRMLRLVAVLAATLWLAVCAEAAAKYITLRTFNPNSGGGIPYGGLLADQAGNLYGANSSGGRGNWGTIFELTPNGQQGWNYSVLYDCGTTTDCAVPMGSLAMDQAGNLCGVTYFGNVFEITHSGSRGWTATVLYAFMGGLDGIAPSPVILDAAGNLYGTNATGGRDNLGYVFELSASEGRWPLIHLYDFTGRDGAETTNTAGGQVAALIQAASGILYGTTSLGGTSTKCKGGCGVVFELKSESGNWTETVLHSFTGSDGSNPDAALLRDADGKLYGTAASGGTNGLGVVFEMAESSGTWRTRVLHRFSGSDLDGAYPNSALVMDTSGNLYGATFAGGGGPRNCQVLTDVGCGVVFELSPQRCAMGNIDSPCL
ncbi:MAG: choice-of-anchor tandem repeat GloVer-containing protein [Candidatus Sulfotelmatobacter sp.]